MTKHEEAMHDLETTRRAGEQGGPMRGILVALALSLPAWGAGLYWWLA